MYKLKNLPFVIAVRRKDLGMTQKQLADKLNVSSQAVSKWETGLSYPDVTVLPELANVLEVSLDVLFGNGDLETSDKKETYNFPDEYKGLKLLAQHNNLACYGEEVATLIEGNKLYFRDGSEVDLEKAIIMSKGSILLRLVRDYEMQEFLQKEDETKENFYSNSTGDSVTMEEPTVEYTREDRLSDFEKKVEKEAEKIEKEAERFEQKFVTGIDGFVNKMASFAQDISDYSVKTFNEVKNEINKEDVNKLKEATSNFAKSAMNIGSVVWKETSEAFKEAKKIFDAKSDNQECVRRDFVAKNVQRSECGKVACKTKLESLIFNIKSGVDVDLVESDDDSLSWSFKNEGSVLPIIEVEESDSVVKFNITRGTEQVQNDSETSDFKLFGFRINLGNMVSFSSQGLLTIKVPSNQIQTCDVQIMGLSKFSSKIPVGTLIAKLSGSGDIFFPAVHDLDVRISGRGDVSVEESCNAKINISGSGDCSIGKLNGGDIEVSVRGSGDVVVREGQANNVEVRISGSGDFTARNLIANEAEFYINGSGDVEIDRVINKVVEQGTRSSQIKIRHRGLN